MRMLTNKQTNESINELINKTKKKKKKHSLRGNVHCLTLQRPTDGAKIQISGTDFPCFFSPSYMYIFLLTNKKIKYICVLFSGQIKKKNNEKIKEKIEAPEELKGCLK